MRVTAPWRNAVAEPGGICGMHELRIVVGDDQALMRDALRYALEADGGCRVVAEAESGRELLELVRRTEADVVLLDLTMPPMDGLECLEHLREEHPDLVVIVVSGCDDQRQIEAAFRRGANAYVLKSMDPYDLPALIRQTIEGTAFVMARTAPDADPANDWRRILSERELSVLAHVAEGLTNKQIAALLWLSEQTIKFHVRNVYRKLGVSSRTEALRFAHEHDLVNVLA
jgi:two-component system NarL family response regulator